MTTRPTDPIIFETERSLVMARDAALVLTALAGTALLAMSAANRVAAALRHGGPCGALGLIADGRGIPGQLAQGR